MAITLDIEVGDIVLGGKFKNKRVKVKSIGTDELGQPTINGKPLLKFRIEKLMPKEKQSKKTREALDEDVGFSDTRFKKLAGLLKEQADTREDLMAWVQDNFTNPHEFIQSLETLLSRKEREALKQRFEDRWRDFEMRNKETY